MDPADIFKIIMKNEKNRKVFMEILHQNKEVIEAHKKDREQANIICETPPPERSKPKNKVLTPTALFRKRALATSNECRGALPEADTLKPNAQETPNKTSVPIDRILEGVVAFVEIEDKLGAYYSNATKQMLLSMGAKVLNELNKKVTHVIFQGGSYKIFQIAKANKIPLVSTKWLAECFEQRLNLRPDGFPILDNSRISYRFKPVDKIRVGFHCTPTATITKEAENDCFRNKPQSTPSVEDALSLQENHATIDNKVKICGQHLKDEYFPEDLAAEDPVSNLLVSKSKQGTEGFSTNNDGHVDKLMQYLDDLNDEVVTSSNNLSFDTNNTNPRKGHSNVTSSLIDMELTNVPYGNEIGNNVYYRDVIMPDVYYKEFSENKENRSQLSFSAKNVDHKEFCRNKENISQISFSAKNVELDKVSKGKEIIHSIFRIARYIPEYPLRTSVSSNSAKIFLARNVFKFIRIASNNFYRQNLDLSNNRIENDTDICLAESCFSNEQGASYNDKSETRRRSINCSKPLIEREDINRFFSNLDQTKTATKSLTENKEIAGQRNVGENQFNLSHDKTFVRTKNERRKRPVKSRIPKIVLENRNKSEGLSKSDVLRKKKIINAQKKLKPKMKADMKRSLRSSMKMNKSPGPKILGVPNSFADTEKAVECFSKVSGDTPESQRSTQIDSQSDFISASNDNEKSEETAQSQNLLQQHSGGQTDESPNEEDLKKGPLASRSENTQNGLGRKKIKADTLKIKKEDNMKRNLRSSQKMSKYTEPKRFDYSTNLPEQTDFKKATEYFSEVSEGTSKSQGSTQSLATEEYLMSPLKISSQSGSHLSFISSSNANEKSEVINKTARSQNLFQQHSSGQADEIPNKEDLKKEQLASHLKNTQSGLGRKEIKANTLKTKKEGDKKRSSQKMSKFTEPKRFDYSTNLAENTDSKNAAECFSQVSEGTSKSQCSRQSLVTEEYLMSPLKMSSQNENQSSFLSGSNASGKSEVMNKTTLSQNLLQQYFGGQTDESPNVKDLKKKQLASQSKNVQSVTKLLTPFVNDRPRGSRRRLNLLTPEATKDENRSITRSSTSKLNVQHDVKLLENEGTKGRKRTSSDNYGEFCTKRRKSKISVKKVESSGEQLTPGIEIDEPEQVSDNSKAVWLPTPVVNGLSTKSTQINVKSVKRYNSKDYPVVDFENIDHNTRYSIEKIRIVDNLIQSQNNESFSECKSQKSIQTDSKLKDHETPDQETNRRVTRSFRKSFLLSMETEELYNTSRNPVSKSNTPQKQKTLKQKKGEQKCKSEIKIEIDKEAQIASVEINSIDTTIPDTLSNSSTKQSSSSRESCMSSLRLSEKIKQSPVKSNGLNNSKEKSNFEPSMVGRDTPISKITSGKVSPKVTEGVSPKNQKIGSFITTKEHTVVKKLRKLYNPGDIFDSFAIDTLEVESSQPTTSLIRIPVIKNNAIHVKAFTPKMKPIRTRKKQSVSPIKKRRSSVKISEVVPGRSRTSLTTDSQSLTSPDEEVLQVDTNPANSIASSQDGLEDARLVDNSLKNQKPLSNHTRKSLRLSQLYVYNYKDSPNFSLAKEGNLISADRCKNRVAPSLRRSSFDFQDIRKFSKKVKPTIIPSIVCTKMHTAELKKLESAIKKLGIFNIDNEVGSRTTHVILGETKRTLKLLKGIARGCWILKKEWILDSLKTGKWLPEEDYEVLNFSPAVQKCRLERKAFGPTYTLDIFEKFGPIYVTASTTPSCTELKRLITLCKGRTTTSLDKASLVVGVFVENKRCVTELWVLDSITYGYGKQLKKYLIKCDRQERPESPIY